MSTLMGSVRAATPGALGFDTDAALTTDAIKQLATQFAFCIRYVAFDAPTDGDLTFDEAAAILEGGLALMPVYPCPYVDAIWQPDAVSGAKYGRRAVASAEAVGLPKNVNLWMDLEGIAPSCPAQNVLDHCNAWYDIVENAGYVPGIYVGVPCGLTGDQLFNGLKYHHYWRSLSGTTPDVPTRGFQLVQSGGGTVDGVSIDRNVAQRDLLGGNAQWLVLAH